MRAGERQRALGDVAGELDASDSVTVVLGESRFAVGFFFFQAEDGIRDLYVTGVQTCVFRSRPTPSLDCPRSVCSRARLSPAGAARSRARSRTTIRRVRSTRSSCRPWCSTRPATSSVVATASASRPCRPPPACSSRSTAACGRSRMPRPRRRWSPSFRRTSSFPRRLSKYEDPAMEPVPRPPSKRVLDLVVAGALLVVLSPVVVVVFLAFAFDALLVPRDRGGILYHEPRISSGRTFGLLKFRTLRRDVLDEMRRAGGHARLYEADLANLT